MNCQLVDIVNYLISFFIGGSVGYIFCIKINNKKIIQKNEGGGDNLNIGKIIKK